jgi:hypothetical protein
MTKTELYDFVRAELNKDEASNRYLCIISLGHCRKMFQIDPDEIILGLIHHSLLTDPNDHVRWYAAQALGELGFDESILVLEEAKQVRNLKEFQFDPNKKETSLKMIKDEIEKSIFKIRQNKR